MKKTLMIMLALVLVIAMSVTGTLAYLTSTDEVTNTFTYGKLAIILNEAPVDENGKETTGDRVKANSYKLIPGHEYDKDPTVWVQPDSEASWLFVKVENGLVNIIDATTIEDQILAKGWTALSGVANVYYKQADAVAEDAAAKDYVVFDGFKLKGDAVVSNYANAQIKVTAYAVQLDGFENDVAAAWNVVK